MRKARAALFIFVCFAVACGGGLYLRDVVTKAVKPARVVVLFSVEGQDGVITDLQRSNFTISEDGRPVSNAADWQLTKADLRANHRALLLVDMGGRIGNADRTAVANAARIFVDRMRGVGKMAVYAFDGAAQPYLITPFSEDVPQEDLNKLEEFVAKDVSTDLHSNYQAAHDALAAELKSDAFGVGALVLVSRAPDRASRVSGSDLLKHIDSADIRVPRHAIGVGDAAREAGLESISTEEPVYVATARDLGKALYDLATRLRTQSASYYLLSFCSAARAGQHELTIDAHRKIKDKNGDELDQWGTLSHVFSADGFGAGCDPTATDEQPGGGQGGAGGSPPAASAVPEIKEQPKEKAPEPKASGPRPAIPVPEPGGSSN